MRAQPTYVVVCEGIHSVGSEPCSFLDLLIDGVLPKLAITAAQQKPVTPLCPTSAHVESIHLSWPNAVANRVYQLSGCNPLAVFKLIHRYQYAGSHPLTLSVLSKWTPRPIADTAPGNHLNQHRMPFVMRYHPCFRLAFYRTIRMVPPPIELGLSVFPCWKNALPSLTGLVQSAALNSLTRDKGSREGVCFLFPFRFPNLETNILREFNIENMCRVFESA